MVKTSSLIDWAPVWRWGAPLELHTGGSASAAGNVAWCPKWCPNYGERRVLCMYDAGGSRDARFKEGT